MHTIPRLYVIWRAPTEQGTRHVVGILQRVAEGYSFTYDTQATIAAQRDGFIDIPGLPLEQTTYRSGYLFPIFQSRRPSPARRDFARMMTSWGVENPDDAMEVLARSGGILATDRIELAEYRTDSDPLVDPLEFRIAGLHRRPEGANKLCLEMELALQREPTNAADPQATMVLTLEGQKLGYVPKQYTALFAAKLDAGTALTVRTVRKLLLPDTIGAWVVRVSLATATASQK